MRKAREYWRAAKGRFRVLKTVNKVIKSLLATDSAFWLSRNLDDEFPELDLKIPIEFNIHDTSETIAYIKSFEQRWMNNHREIELGLKENHLFSNAKYNGKIIACSKVGINKVYIDDYREEISVPPKVAVGIHSYVTPEYRGHNIAGAIRIKIMLELRDKGYKIITAQISPWNIASLNYHKKIGAKKIVYIRHFRIFGIIKFWYVNNLITGSKRLVFNISKLLPWRFFT